MRNALVQVNGFVMCESDRNFCKCIRTNVVRKAMLVTIDDKDRISLRVTYPTNMLHGEAAFNSQVLLISQIVNDTAVNRRHYRSNSRFCEYSCLLEHHRMERHAAANNNTCAFDRLLIF